MHNHVNVTNATELCAHMVKTVNPMLCVFYYNLLKAKKKEKEEESPKILTEGDKTSPSQILPPSLTGHESPLSSAVVRSQASCLVSFSKIGKMDQ